MSASLWEGAVSHTHAPEAWKGNFCVVSSLPPKAKTCGKELEASVLSLWLFSPKTHASILANLPLIGNVYGKKCGSHSSGLEIIGRTQEENQ